MLTPLPTRRGDVLILATLQNRANYAVTIVMAAGQQDCGAEFDGMYTPVLSDAVTRAQRMLIPGRRVYFLNTDNGDWIVLVGDAFDDRSQTARA